MTGDFGKLSSVLLRAAALCMAVPPALASAAPKIESGTSNAKGWRPETSVTLREFGNDGAVTMSPGGRWLAFTEHSGSIECDCTTSTLLIYDTEAVRRAIIRDAKFVAPARKVVRLTPTNQRPLLYYRSRAISGLSWKDDKALYFEGVDEVGVGQLYSINVDGGELHQETNWRSAEIEWTEFAGKSRVANGFVPGRTEEGGYPVRFFTRRDMLNTIVPPNRGMERRTFVQFGGSAPWIIPGSGPTGFERRAFSPDGTRFIDIRTPDRVPAEWETYDNVRPLKDVSQFFLIEPAGRQVSEALAAPTGDATQIGASVAEQNGRLRPHALWAADNRHVILVNTALPRNVSGSKNMAFVASVDTSEANFQPIEPLVAGKSKVTDVRWHIPGDELAIEHSSSDGKSVISIYRLRGLEWQKIKDIQGDVVKASRRTEGDTKLRIGLREDGTHAPEMIASYNGKSLSLSGPDPALVTHRPVDAQEFSWQELDGLTHRGGLLLPHGRGPFPLVIQAYDYEPQSFRPDGPENFTYAGQSLVASGFAVITIDIPSSDVPPNALTLKELQRFVNRVDDVIDALNAKRLIDPTRVGVIGFSRAGYNIYYAITHPGKHRLGAAIVDSSFTGTVFSYAFDAGLTPGVRPEYEKMYGGSFWSNPSGWLASDPSLNIGSIQTPVLFTIHNETSLLRATETSALFEANDVPFEYVVYPHAMHPLAMPRQRAASQQLTLDWMGFWLQGKAPADLERNYRWERLRER